MTVEEKHAQARAALERTFANTAEWLRPYMSVTFTPNNMAAGPCTACLAAAQGRYTFQDAPLAPLDACPHPDQCVGFLSTDIDWDGLERDIDAGKV